MKTFGFEFKKNTLGILCVTTLIAIVSCGENESPSNKIDENSIISIIDSNIKAYILKNANDPSSYQPIKTACIDTLKTGDIEIFWLRRDTMVEKVMIKETNKSIAEHRGYAMHTDIVTVDAIKEYQKDNAKRERVIQEKLLQIDSIIKAVKGNQKIEGYTYLHEYRLKNKFGALVLEKKFVRANPNLEITYFGEDRYEFPSVKIEF
jgi:hypothetical protein